MRYYVISSSEDGISIYSYTKQGLLEALADESALKNTEFFGQHDGHDSDPQYWGGKCLIVKGQVVTPRAVKVVTQLEID